MMMTQTILLRNAEIGQIGKIETYKNWYLLKLKLSRLKSVEIELQLEIEAGTWHWN